MIYALDANIISYMLNNDEKVNKQVDMATKNGHTFIIPPIVDYEVRRGLLAKDYLKKLRKFELLEQIINVGTFDVSIWRKAAQIYATLSKRGIPIGNKYDGDVFIGAYCILNDYTLVTNDADHFGRIDDLKFVNWSA